MTVLCVKSIQHPLWINAWSTSPIRQKKELNGKNGAIPDEKVFHWGREYFVDGIAEREEAKGISQKILIKEPYDVLTAIQIHCNKKVEHFGIICLDGSHQIISKAVLFKGGYTKTIIDTRVALYYAIKHRAVAVIAWHNHPSGNTEPSEEDNKATDNLKKAFEVCGMELLDHMIISKYSYFSYSDMTEFKGFLIG